MTFIRPEIMKDVVAFMLVQNGSLLLEKTSITKKYNPGEIQIPRGKVEFGEALDDALRREMGEELSLSPVSYRQICTLLRDYDDHSARIHYFLVDDWRGRLVCKEAESVEWADVDDISSLGPTDSAAMEIYGWLRRYFADFLKRTQKHL